MASLWSNVHPSLVLGTGYTTVGSAQQVWLANTPEPGLENTYASSGKQYNSILFGFALEKAFTNHHENIEPAAGLEADYLRNSNMSGVVHPMVNVDPDFDRLNYSFRMNSYLLFATGKLSMLNIISKLGGYLQAGVGGAFNKLSNYNETSPTGSSAAPSLAPFRDRSNKKFAYFLGAGIVCQMSKATQILIGYRYINSGQSGFNTSPIQQTKDTLNFSTLSNHFLTISLVV